MNPCSGYASLRTEMIASSAAWSTSETKSFCCLARMVSLSRSKEARVMMLPALRAAFTAVLSIGCMARMLPRLGRPREKRHEAAKVWAHAAQLLALGVGEPREDARSLRREAQRDAPPIARHALASDEAQAHQPVGEAHGAV